MEIPNLAQKIPHVEIKVSSKNNLIILSIIVMLAIASGFWLSRFFPTSSSSSVSQTIGGEKIASTDDIESADELVVGQLYGDIGKNFTDTAVGKLVAGGISGEGTHTLERSGGKTQNAALTSSTVDLDLFVGKNVEIKGETNASNKAGWFLDVGVIKIIE